MVLQVQIDDVNANNEFTGLIIEDAFSEMLTFATDSKEINVYGVFYVDSDGLVIVEYIYIEAGTKTYKAELTDFDLEQVTSALQRRLQ